MLRVKNIRPQSRENQRGLKIERLFFFFLAFVFLTALPLKLSAKTDKTLAITLNLEEWLILEVSSDNFQAKDVGQRQAQVEAMITLGQPIFVRALLAINHGKKVILKAILFPLEKSVFEHDLKLKWQGEGDLAGNGIIKLNESTTLATWPDQGFKIGTIVFENIYESSPFPLKGVFTLISY